MAKNNISSHLNTLFFSLFFLLLHLSCFICFSSQTTTTNNKNYLRTRKKRKPLSPQKAFSSSWSFIKKIFIPKNIETSLQTRPSTPTNTTKSFCSPRTSSHYDPERLFPTKRRSGSRSEYELSLYENPLLPLRNDIYPCPVCGEIFQKPNLLEQHQAIKHAVSELRDGDSGKNIVWIIFKTGWETHTLMEPRFGNGLITSPKIHRILKIHNGQKILSRFEEYREIVKESANKNGLRRHERCIADGNELLRFYCTTFVCGLGQNGNSCICNNNYCSACGIIRAGFSPKLDGISTLSSSWRAHVAIPGDVEDEFAFMNVKRAMLVCRVIAGRVGCDSMITEVDKEDQGFDSIMSRGISGHGRLDDDELVVFNPWAVLPCFVIVYSV